MNDKKPTSNLVVASQLKLELLLWLAVVGKLLNVLVFRPLSMEQYKEIFMGMNVQLPKMTEIVLRYSDFVRAWYPITVLLVAGGLFAMYSGSKLIIAMATSKNTPENRAKFELQLTTALIITFFMLQFIESSMNSLVMAPMLRLVNAY